jgi:hypothetical protein
MNCFAGMRDELVGCFSNVVDAGKRVRWLKRWKIGEDFCWEDRWGRATIRQRIKTILLRYRTG